MQAGPFKLETQRLKLREFNPGTDAEFAYRLNADPEVLKYTGDAPFVDEADARKFLENYTDYTTHGMGRWLVELQDGTPIGWCGLKQHQDYVDLGFRFLRSEWGKGYATEAALACIEFGFDVLKLDSIVGRVSPENTPSIRVLEKCGMTYWKQDECKGIEDALYYRILRNSARRERRIKVQVTETWSKDMNSHW